MIGDLFVASTERTVLGVFRPVFSYCQIFQVSRIECLADLPNPDNRKKTITSDPKFLTVPPSRHDHESIDDSKMQIGKLE